MTTYTIKFNKNRPLGSRRISPYGGSDNRTITDYWAAALGRQLINRTDGGPEITFSSIVNTSSFQSYNQPFPLVVIDSRRPGEYIINLNSTVYEISPYEFGTWDSRVNLFTPTQYLGSNLTNGQLVSNNTCVTDFDNAAYFQSLGHSDNRYVLGSSSTLFNQILLNLPSGNASTAQTLVESVLQAFNKSEEDIAPYPNPFKAINGSSNTVSKFPNLTLVDGVRPNLYTISHVGRRSAKRSALAIIAERT